MHCCRFKRLGSSWERYKTRDRIAGCRLHAAVTLAEGVQNKLDPAGNSQLFEDAINVVSYGMLLDLELLSNFTVLQAVGDQTHDLFLPACQERHPVGIV